MEMPQIFLNDTPEGKMRVLRTMSSGATLTHEGKIEIQWPEPYSFLMREELGLVSDKADASETGFKTDPFCAPKVTRLEPPEEVLDAVILDFKLWMMAG